MPATRRCRPQGRTAARVVDARNPGPETGGERHAFRIHVMDVHLDAALQEDQRHQQALGADPDDQHGLRAGSRQGGAARL